MSYKKGVRAEKKSRKWLEAQGCFVVESRGSHGACDLVAIFGGKAQAIQVKAGRKPTQPEIARMREALVAIPCPGVLHWWKDYAREPIVEVLC